MIIPERIQASWWPGRHRPPGLTDLPTGQSADRRPTEGAVWLGQTATPRWGLDARRPHTEKERGLFYVSTG